MNINPATLIAACLFLIAALAAVLIGVEIRTHKAKTTKDGPAQPGLDRDDLHALRALLEGLDDALERFMAAVRNGGRDDDAIALLGLLDRADISASRLRALAAALAQVTRTGQTAQSRDDSATGTAAAKHAGTQPAPRSSATAAGPQERKPFMQDTATTTPIPPAYSEPEADFLKNLAPAPAAPNLFACWQTPEGGTTCQTLPAVTAALAKSQRGHRFDPYGNVDADRLEAALATAIPELCHPSGYQLIGIGLAAAGEGSVALDAWIAQETGRARTWQLGDAEAQGRVEPDDHALFGVPEARLLTALERLRARATGTKPVLVP